MFLQCYIRALYYEHNVDLKYCNITYVTINVVILTMQTILRFCEESFFVG